MMVAGKNIDIPERVYLRVKAGLLLEDGGCHVWIGRVNEKGYGRVSWAEGRAYVHRIVWLVECGPIGDGLELDHLCRNKRCCNVAHLEPVTHVVNFQRSLDTLRAAARLRVKTHCKRGHPLSGENLYLVPRTGDRCCRECRRVEARERYRRKAIRERGSVKTQLPRVVLKCPSVLVSEVTT